MLGTSTPAVELDSVAHRFGARWALRGVTLRVAAGEIVGVTGANGSGKSTLLRIVATLVRPTRGTGRVLGLDLARDASRVRDHVALLGDVHGTYGDLTALENLAFAARMRGVRVTRAELLARLEAVGLSHAADERARGFSSGMQRRLALARVGLAPARVLLLDEPYNSLDDDGVALVNAALLDLQSRGGAALVVTHVLAPADGVLDRVVALAGGVLRPADASPRALPSRRVVSGGVA